MLDVGFRPLLGFRPMIRKLLGAVFFLAALAGAYLFAANSLRTGEAPAGAFFAVPFHALGRTFPIDAFLLVGTILLTVLALVCILGGSASGEAGDPPRRSGALTVLFLANAFAVLASFGITYIGGAAGADSALVGVFALAAAAQIAVGAILGFLASLEKLKSTPLFVTGWIAYVAGLACLGLMFLWGR